MVYFSLTTEFMYYLLVTSTHMFSSTIMITSLPDILIKTKHWNQFIMDIPSSASVLIYNNSTSPVSLVYNSSYNITSTIDLSNNSLFLNDHGISFLQTLLRNFYHSPDLILSWSQSTSLLSRQFLSLSMISSHLQTQHICLSFMYFPYMVFLPMSSLTKTQSLCQTSSNLQALLLTCGFTSLQAIIPKIMDKLNT